MDREYWESFYKHRLAVNFPSSFAEFCLENYIPRESCILELGSGNGRDAFYFSEQQNDVIAVDQSAEVYHLEEEKLDASPTKSRLKIVRDDFVQMDYSKHEGVDVIYSRFTLHAISQEEENAVIDKAYRLLPAGGLFLIEARTVKDPLCGEGEPQGNNAFVTDHYRRFIDSQTVIRNVMNLGYEVLFFVEKNGLSVYKEDDPVLMRIVLKKSD